MKRKKVQELREEMAKITADQRAIVDKVDAEKRDWTADETTNYENMDVRWGEIQDEIKTLNDEIAQEERELQRREKLQAKEDYLKTSQHFPTRPDPNINRDNQDNRDKKQMEFAEYAINEKRYGKIIRNFRKETGGIRSTQAYLTAYSNYLRGGEAKLSAEARALLSEAAIAVRALQKDSDTVGGYLVVPEQMVFQIIEDLDNEVFVRQWADVTQMPNAQSLGIPARETDMSAFTWEAEITTAAQDTGLTFGKRELRPHPLSGVIRVSRPMVRMAMIDIAGYVAGRAAYQMGIAEEGVFMTGSGVNQPLGVFTNSANGISEARDISTGNTTSAITADGLINCQMNLKKQYRRRPSCRWLFHRDAVKQIRKLKTGDGDYLWRMGLADGTPETILAMPYEESEYAPSTFTTGQYVGILGDWSYYRIVDSLAMEILVADQLYIATNQIGYFFRKETDGMPVLENAWSRLKLA